MSNIPVYNGSGGTTTTTTPTTATTQPLTVNLPNPTTTTTPTSTVGTAGTFPGAQSADPIAAELESIYNLLNGPNPVMNTSQFFAWAKVPSSAQSLYLDTSGKLNNNAVFLYYYKNLDRQGKQQIQDEMVQAGVLQSTEATGFDTATAQSAFQTILGSSAVQGVDAFSYLQQQAQLGSGTNAIQNTISNELTAAQKAATAPLAISETNPTTLAADITNAFDQALGYAPTQDQVQAFIKQIQGQETTYGSAPRAEAQAQIDQAHSEESALNKLGPDGLDAVIRAYQAAVTGTGLPGVGTQQGPVNGAVPNDPSKVPGYEPAGTPLAPGDAVRYTPSGQVVGGNILPKQTTTTQDVPEGGIEGWVDNNSQLHIPFTNWPAHYQVENQVSKTTNSFVHNVMPGMPAGAAGSTTTHGGIFALSSTDWQEAQKLLPSAKKYPTPGQAPVAVQQSAISELLQHQYETNGQSWSKAIASIASGSPFGTAEGTHLAAFGNQVAAQVDAQIKTMQSQVDNSSVTVKVTQPDATAEAAASAKQSDPVGYYAANAASFGQLLNQMLAGAPQMYSQGTADAFTGPVSVGAATTPTAPTATASLNG